MFTDVGWGEIFVLLIVGLVVIGPERLPRVIQDLRAALTAARTAINNAKQGLNDEFGSEFDDFRKPLGEIAALGAMGPRAALTKTLLDGDSSFLDSFDPKKIMAEEETAGEAERRRAAEKRSGSAVNNQIPDTPETQRVERPEDGQNKGQASGGFSWADIT